jgi:hypothetical protein
LHTEFGSPPNRKIAEAQAVLIDHEIEHGTFDYLRWFPQGNKAEHFKQTVAPTMVGEYYVIWIERKKPPLVREGLEYDYRRQFSRYILPKFASCELAQVTPKLLEAFRTYLLTELGLSLKSCRNIIDGTFRAMMRDARIIDQLIDKKIHSSFSVGPGSDVQSRIPSPRKNGTKFSRRSKAKIPFTTRLSIRSFGPECGRRKRLHFAGEMLTFRQSGSQLQSRVISAPKTRQRPVPASERFGYFPAWRLC